MRKTYLALAGSIALSAAAHADVDLRAYWEARACEVADAQHNQACLSGKDYVWKYHRTDGAGKYVGSSSYKTEAEALNAMNAAQTLCQMVSRYWDHTDCPETFEGVYCAACGPQDEPSTPSPCALQREDLSKAQDQLITYVKEAGTVASFLPPAGVADAYLHGLGDAMQSLVDADGSVRACTPTETSGSIDAVNTAITSAAQARSQLPALPLYLAQSEPETDQKILISDLASGEALPLSTLDGNQSGCQVLIQGLCLDVLNPPARGLQDFFVASWDAFTGERVSYPWARSAGPVQTLHSVGLFLGSDPDLLAVAGADGLGVYAATGLSEPASRPSQATGELTSLWFSDDGGALGTIHAGDSFLVFNPADLSQPITTLKGNWNDAAFAAQSGVLFLAGDAASGGLVELDSGDYSLKGRRLPSGKPALSVAVSDDESVVAAGGPQGTVSLYSNDGGELQHWDVPALTTPSGFDVTRLAFSAGGRYLFAQGSSTVAASLGAVEIYDLEGKKWIASGDTLGQAFGMSPDRAYAWIRKDGRVRVYGPLIDVPEAPKPAPAPLPIPTPTPPPTVGSVRIEVEDDSMSSDADNNQLEVRLQSNSYFTGPGRHDLTISDFEPTGTLLIQLICRNAYDGVCRPALTVRFDDGRPTLGLGHPEIPVGSTYVAKLSCVASGCTLQ